MSRRGFTLIEVAVAMMLMTFISLFTVQSLRRALDTKQKMQHDIDKNATVRDALRVMERDINMAFNYRDVGIELYNQAQDARKAAASAPAAGSTGTTGTPGATATPTPAPAAQVDPEKYKHKVDKILTQFIGEETQLSFTSLSNVRMTAESAVCSQAEIGYRLKSCRRRSNQEQSSQCLWRRLSDFIHEDITREGTETVLLENVTAFKLRYLGPGKEQEWLDQWITDDRGDAVTKGVFPYAVEITIEVQDTNPGAKDKKLRMTTVAAIRNPNNPKPQNPDGTPANGNQNQPAGQPTTQPTSTPPPSTQ